MEYTILGFAGIKDTNRQKNVYFTLEVADELWEHRGTLEDHIQEVIENRYGIILGESVIHVENPETKKTVTYLYYD